MGAERVRGSQGVNTQAVGLSVVVPLYDEVESLPELHAELLRALNALGLSWEILYIDDGSRDGSDRVIGELAATDPRVRAVSFRRNFGKSAALAVGFKQARGELVATMDADLQDDPAELKDMRDAMGTNFDLISGWKRNRQDPLTKTIPSRLFNMVTSRVAGIKLHDFNCGLKLYRREVIESIEVYGELHRFLPAIANWQGFRVGEVPVHHRARKFGYSKFGVARFVNGFLDLMSAAFITTSALKPLHVFGRVGLLFFAVGTAIGLWFVGLFLHGEPIHVRPLMLFGAGLVLLGFQFVLMGLLGEMIAHLGARSDYPLKRSHNWDVPA